MISFDFKSGYHHIDIHKDHQTFLGFQEISQTNSLKCFVFTVLPFGLSSAPYVFTKCLKPLEKYWRLQGVNIALFLDDGWLIEHGSDDCLALANQVRSDLRKAGLISNDEKSTSAPCQVIQWLGIVWNTRESFVISAKQLVSFTEKIISTGQCCYRKYYQINDETLFNVSKQYFPLEF